MGYFFVLACKIFSQQPTTGESAVKNTKTDIKYSNAVIFTRTDQGFSRKPPILWTAVKITTHKREVINRLKLVNAVKNTWIFTGKHLNNKNNYANIDADDKQNKNTIPNVKK